MQMTGDLSLREYFIYNLQYRPPLTYAMLALLINVDERL